MGGLRRWTFQLEGGLPFDAETHTEAIDRLLARAAVVTHADALFDP